MLNVLAPSMRTTHDRITMFKEELRGLCHIYAMSDEELIRRLGKSLHVTPARYRELQTEKFTVRWRPTDP